MEKRDMEKAIENMLHFEVDNLSMTRLEAHEAMKALLFIQRPDLHPRLETSVDLPDRAARADYMDTESIIEIDDAMNAKSIRKMLAAAQDGYQPYWIALCHKGKGGKMIHQAKKADIPCAILLLGSGRHSWHWA